LTEEIEKAIGLCHTKEYREGVKARCAGLEENKTEADREKDIYYSKGSYQAALLSA